MKIPNKAKFYLNNDSTLYGEGHFVKMLHDIDSLELELITPLKGITKGESIVVPFDDVVSFA